MFIEDLSRLEVPVNSIAVGWLAREHPFPIGPTSADFCGRLSELSKRPVRLTRGFHLCPFCESAPARGNGEIEVFGKNGELFVSPVLVAHYVIAHDYCPPKAFIESVEHAGERNAAECRQLSLEDSIIALADARNPRARDDFYTSFLASRVGVRVPKKMGTIPSGEYVANAGTMLPMTIGQSANGSPMLVVFAGINKLAAQDSTSTFLEFTAADVLRIAALHGAGIVVQASCCTRQAWAGIPKEDVMCLIGLVQKK